MDPNALARLLNGMAQIFLEQKAAEGLEVFSQPGVLKKEAGGGEAASARSPRADAHPATGAAVDADSGKRSQPLILSSNQKPIVQ